MTDTYQYILQEKHQDASSLVAVYLALHKAHRWFYHHDEFSAQNRHHTPGKSLLHSLNNFSGILNII